MFWVGELERRTQNYEASKTWWTEYYHLGQNLYQRDPNNFDWIMEAAWGAQNLGVAEVNLKNPEMALTYLEEALKFFTKAKQLNTSSQSVMQEIANTYGWAADAAWLNGPVSRSVNYRTLQIEIFDEILSYDSHDTTVKHNKNLAVFSLVHLLENSRQINKSEEYFKALLPKLNMVANQDKDNIGRQRGLLRYLYSQSLYAIRDANFQGANTSLAELKKLRSEQASRFGPLQEADEQLIVILEAHYQVAIGNKNNATEIVRNLEGLVRNVKIGPVSKLNFDSAYLSLSHLLNLSYEVDSQELPEVFAERLLLTLSNHASILDPEQLGVLMRSQLVLNQCSAAEKIRASLSGRGYHIKVYYKLAQTCPDWPGAWTKESTLP